MQDEQGKKPDEQPTNGEELRKLYDYRLEDGYEPERPAKWRSAGHGWTPSLIGSWTDMHPYDDG